MGIARDLLEGGKPNMYFYVVTKATAKELAVMLDKKAKLASKNNFSPKFDKKRVKTDEKLPGLTVGKLDSSFYLVPYADITVDYNYRLKLNPKKVIRLHRKYAPRVKWISQAFDGFGYKVKRALGIGITRACGEALLACLYFAGTCPRVYENAGAAITEK